MGFPEQTWIIGSGSSLHKLPTAPATLQARQDRGRRVLISYEPQGSRTIGLGCRKLTWRSNEASRSGA